MQNVVVFSETNMCGFTVLLTNNDSRKDRYINTFDIAMKKIRHRGPDYSETIYERGTKEQVAPTQLLHLEMNYHDTNNLSDLLDANNELNKIRSAALP